MKRILMVFLALGFITGCGDNSKKRREDNLARSGDRLRNDGMTNNGVPIPGSPQAAGSLWAVLQVQPGQIQTASGSSFVTASDMSRFFLSTDWLFKDVGAITVQDSQDPIPCRAPYNTNCGTMITTSNSANQPSLGFQGASSLQQALTQNRPINLVSQGAISLVFFDAFTGYNNFDPVPITVQVTGGQVTGNASCTMQSCGQPASFQIVASDSMGTVQIDGTISGATITGNVSFRNTVSKDSAHPAPNQGRLGTFSAPACAIFPCQ